MRSEPVAFAFGPFDFCEMFFWGFGEYKSTHSLVFMTLWFVISGCGVSHGFAILVVCLVCGGLPICKIFVSTPGV